MIYINPILGFVLVITMSWKPQEPRLLPQSSLQYKKKGNLIKLKLGLPHIYKIHTRTETSSELQRLFEVLLVTFRQTV